MQPSWPQTLDFVYERPILGKGSCHRSHRSRCLLRVRYHLSSTTAFRRAFSHSGQSSERTSHTWHFCTSGCPWNWQASYRLSRQTFAPAQQSVRILFDVCRPWPESRGPACSHSESFSKFRASFIPIFRLCFSNGVRAWSNRFAFSCGIYLRSRLVWPARSLWLSHEQAIFLASSRWVGDPVAWAGQEFVIQKACDSLSSFSLVFDAAC